MSAGRRSARRQAVFVLYQMDLLKLAPGAAFQRTDRADLDPYARGLVLGVAGELPAIDVILQRHVTGWSLDRLGTLERSILRLAAYELLWEAEVPEAVAIDEAVELAKRFCSDEAGALVNGILGSIAVYEKEQIREIRRGQENGSKVTT
ncbi:MAG: transcription antitermination factor NusB [bacterium]